MKNPLSYSFPNKKVLVVLHDLFMVGMAWQLAWWARFNFEFPFFNWDLSVSLIPVLLVIQGFLFWRFRLYRALWRFASLRDLWNIFRASMLGGFVTALALFLLFRLEGVPRSVLLLYPVFLIFLLGGPRLGYRLWKDRDSSFLSTLEKKRVLVIGGGCAGDMLVRDMHRSDSDTPVAILDDDASLSGAEIRGVKIFGAVDQIQHIVKQLSIDWIAIAIPSAKREQLQEIIKLSEATYLPIRILPSLIDNAQDLLSDLREVSIEDLLGREPVNLDWKNIQDIVSEKCVIVTGGGGSIGSVLSQQIVNLSPAKLIIVDNSEYNLYRIQQELSGDFINGNIIFELGDVCDIMHMSQLFEQHKPNLVFHAAAYKHVPILQEQPRQALKNNVLGTKSILDVACKYQAEKFVLISTDKAVNPSNTLGVSKRIAELYAESMNHLHATQCITVRFGNVLDSAGSVIPLFRKQIKNGGPVTITHPEITRFFMTISEASQLILQAASMGRGGEIFVLDMGEPVKIQYLAEQMIILSGKTLNTDIKLSYCGLRSGEKLFEELFYKTEQQVLTAHEKIFLANHSPISADKCVNEINSLIDDNLYSSRSDLADILKDSLGLLENSIQEQKVRSKVVPISRE